MPTGNEEFMDLREGSRDEYIHLPIRKSMISRDEQRIFSAADLEKTGFIYKRV